MAQSIEILESIPIEYSEKNSVRISCTKNVSGAWTDTPMYWDRITDKNSLNDDLKVFHLYSVCWLDYKCSNQVRNGHYACFWRVKLTDLSFKGNWKVGVDCGKFDCSDPPKPGESYTNNGNVIHYAHDEGKGPLTQICDRDNPKFVYIHFGNILLKSQTFVNNLQFSLTQNNPYGVPSMSFDCIELYEIEPLDVSWTNAISITLNIPSSVINVMLEYSGFFDILQE